MKKIIIIFAIILAGISLLVWRNYNNSKKNTEISLKSSLQENSSPQTTTTNEKNNSDQKNISNDQIVPDNSGILAGFPEPSVERVGNIDERTIHMGVRQWEWVPIQLTAREGEKVRLVMHNADVPHSISIPELGVNADIPEDGAVVEFMATKKGTFEFFCNTPCGKDHAKMRGKITIT
jgi:heme/copper-type cytochrome/quinol oxidase subunit 2